MGVFEELGVMVDGLEDESAEEYDGDVEEIFRFDVFLTTEQEIEIGVNIAELEVEEFPDFGEAYGELAQTFADLIVNHIGPYTGELMEEVSDLQELDVQLSEEEKWIAAEDAANNGGRVLLYSFPVLIMEDEDSPGEFVKQMGAGFNRSPKADLMLKIYGSDFAKAEEMYQDKVTDAVLDHGVLFMKAVESITL